MFAAADWNVSSWNMKFLLKKKANEFLFEGNLLVTFLCQPFSIFLLSHQPQCRNFPSTIYDFETLMSSIIFYLHCKTSEFWDRYCPSNSNILFSLRNVIEISFFLQRRFLLWRHSKMFVDILYFIFQSRSWINSHWHRHINIWR